MGDKNAKWYQYNSDHNYSNSKAATDEIELKTLHYNRKKIRKVQ